VIKPAREIPENPGVYIFKDDKSEIIYIGKAKNLKNRVGSYFADPQILLPKTKKMVEVAKSLDFIKTESEIEALLLEADLVKRYKPKYNIELKDDKSYKYIKIYKEKFPKIESARNTTDKKAFHFGPFPRGEAVNEVLRYLRKVFGFRDCSTIKFNRYKKLNRGCLYYDIKLCPAPCIEAVSQKDYRDSISNLRQFLGGKKKLLIRKLTKKMENYSKVEKYEEARETRDLIGRIDYITQSFTEAKDFLINPNFVEDRGEEGIRDILKRVFDEEISYDFQKFRIEAYDISNIQGKLAVGSMVVFIGGVPNKNQYRKFKIKYKNSPDDFMMLREVLSRRFKKIEGGISDESFKETPDLILIDGGSPQLRALSEMIAKLPKNIKVIGLVKGEEKLVLPVGGEYRDVVLPKDSAGLKLMMRARDEAHRFAITYHRNRRSKVLLS